MKGPVLSRRGQESPVARRDARIARPDHRKYWTGAALGRTLKQE